MNETARGKPDSRGGPDRRDGGQMTIWESLAFVWEILIAVAVPAIVFALGGRWLDARLGVFPAFTLIGLALALALTAIIVTRRATRLAERLRHSQNQT